MLQIIYNGNEIRAIDQEWTARNCWANWATMGLLSFTFLFFFFILSHHYERTHKNNYHIYNNTFFIYNILHISHHINEFPRRFAIFYHINEFLRVYRK
jgi:hypothetical protein